MSADQSPPPQASQFDSLAGNASSGASRGAVVNLNEPRQCRRRFHCRSGKEVGGKLVGVDVTACVTLFARLIPLP